MTSARGFAASLGAKDLRSLRLVGYPTVFPAGTPLLIGGFPTERVVLVDAGHLKLTCVTDDGRKVLLGLLGPGDLVGADAALDGDPPSATATAVDTVSTTVLPVSAFRAFLDEHPHAMRQLLVWMTRQLRLARCERVAFVAEGITCRVARRLAALGEQVGEPRDGGVWLTVPLSQTELASWVGASRGAVSQALRSLQGRGLIAVHRRHVSIRDPEGLRQLLQA